MVTVYAVPVLVLLIMIVVMIMSLIIIITVRLYNHTQVSGVPPDIVIEGAIEPGGEDITGIYEIHNSSPLNGMTEDVQSLPGSSVTCSLHSIEMEIPSSSSDKEKLIYRALVVYSLGTDENVVEDILSNLVLGLHSKWQDIEVSCHDLLNKQIKPCWWLEKEVTKVNAVLCVCTEEFKNDWENPGKEQNDSSLIQVLKTYIDARRVLNQKYSKFGNILLKPSDKKLIPDPLQLNQNFNITDLDNITSFIKNKPSYTLPQ